MIFHRKPSYIRLFASVAAILVPASVHAQKSTEERVSDNNVIVVTAQKREQNLNDVPLAVVAASGDDLIKKGISNTGDLVKLVPGFQFTESLSATPVYTIRGIGFYDSSFSATSTVAVYVDEVPMPFAVTTTGAALDLERVEVVKGPQGTLFGQNATGGAINYIAAKPTKEFKAGFDASFGRFNDIEASGFVSGPLSDTLGARLAVKTVQNGDWQRSYTRDDDLGSRNEIVGRLLLDWKPTDRLSVGINLNAWRDKSDLPAGQYVALTPNVPALTPPALAATPFAPNNARAADWTPGYGDYGRDAKFYQGSIRVDYDLTDDISFTSISSLQRLREDRLQDFDGVALENTLYDTNARINNFTQEVRVSGQTDAVNWIIGANYDRSSVYEETYANWTQSTLNLLFTFPPANAALPFLASGLYTDQDYKTQSVFGNVDYEFSDTITGHVGMRYSKLDGYSEGCSYDGGNGGLAEGLTGTYNFVRVNFIGLPAIAPIGLNDCLAANALFEPTTARPELHEDNISWRVGLDFKPTPDLLLYASVSRGYKGGAFPTLAASTADQYDPAFQESLLSYEAGFKAGLLGNRLQINGSAFYYDYSDKQFRGRSLDPTFGVIEKQLNIPRSRIIGAELQIMAEPVDGLKFNGGVTFLDSKVQTQNGGGNFETYDNYGSFGSITGEKFPFTPKWSLSGDLEYSWDLGTDMSAFLGGNLRYQTKTVAAFSNVNSTNFSREIVKIKDYGILDLRAGLGNEEQGWRVSVFGRNVTNTYYWTNSVKALDTTIRYAGRPVTYGVSVSFRTK